MFTQLISLHSLKNGERSEFLPDRIEYQRIRVLVLPFCQKMLSFSISAKIFSKSKRFCLQFQPYQNFERHCTQKEPKNAKKDRFHVKSLVTLVHNFCFWKKILEKFVKWQGDQIPGVPSSFDGNWSKNV